MHDATVILAITAMALVTYATRLAGYWLTRHRRLSHDSRALLTAMPPATMAALITPGLITAGPADWSAAVALLLLASRLPMVPAVALSTAIALVLRAAISAGGAGS